MRDLDSFEPDYLVALDEIYHAHWAARKHLRIKRFRAWVDRLWPKGHPTRFLHITGTNGKGSVAHYLCQGLQIFGRTGSWTGPHVFDYAERFHVNGEQVSHQDIAAIYKRRVQNIMVEAAESGHTLSFAEVGILIALCLFEEKGVDWAVMEVGNGGRYTPLMALDMEACLLTNIGADHPKSLGAEPWQRALEKAGIARSHKPFFTTDRGDTLDYVIKAAEAEGAAVIVVDDGAVTEVREALDEEMGDHTYYNMALATAVIRHYYAGAKLTALLGRMQNRLAARFWQPAPNVLVDVAHNQDKMGRLLDDIQRTFPNHKLHFLLGLSRKRNPLDVFAPLLAHAASITLTSPAHAGRDPHEVAAELGEAHKARVITDPKEAYETCRNRLGDHELLVVTGSAYMIDTAMNPNTFIRDTNACYGRRYTQPGG